MWYNQGLPPGGVGWAPVQSGYLEPSRQAIRFYLTLPDTRVGLGIFAIDPVEELLGCPLATLLQPMMVGPAFERASRLGGKGRVYPLALPEGQGLSLNLGSWGELGFFNDRNWLRLSVPATFQDWVQARVAPLLVRGPEGGLSANGQARVAFFWLQLPPGARVSLEVPMLGEMMLEAG